MDDDFPIAGFLLIIGLLFFLLFIGSKLGRITERGSFQKEAIEQVKRFIKNNNSSRDARYIILEAKKEIGTKSPEIEIEDIK